jgi:hypothetical protein
MSEPTPKDSVLIMLVAQIKKSGSGSKLPNQEFVMLFGPTEVENGLSDGSIAPNLEEAATEAGYDVLRRGPDRASLRKIPNSGVRAFV